MIMEARVAERERTVADERLYQKIFRQFPSVPIKRVRTVRVYRFEASSIDQQALEIFVEYALCNPVTQTTHLLWHNDARIVEVRYKPQVENPVRGTLLKVARDCGFVFDAADESFEVWVYGNVTQEEAEKVVAQICVNPQVQEIVRTPPPTLRISGVAEGVKIISLRAMTEEELVDCARERHFFFDRERMIQLQSLFRDLERDPTDAELEMIVMLKSEHCDHGTFKSDMLVDGKVKSSLMSRLVTASQKYFGDRVVSAFHDNAGVVRFFDNIAIVLKTETHNAPSALEPYGGAMTGVGGVFRDIAGTGLGGARIVAAIDVFCVGSLDMSSNGLPLGCIHPREMLSGIVRGVADYGNQMGVPTVCGSVHAHEDFTAKPTVLCGAIGIMPIDRAQKGAPMNDDVIIMLGGKRGRDGIHGATFSSDAMTDRTAEVIGTAVQIGNPIEEKRTCDALIEIAQHNIIHAITDCGAGGLACAVSEMCEHVGVYVQLDHVPQKYAGLAPWEIWVSESQETMIIAVARADVEIVECICKSFNVEATPIGVCTGDQHLKVIYNDISVCDLPMRVVHHGFPKSIKKAEWKWMRPILEELIIAMPKNTFEWENVLCTVLAHPNVCSKEAIIRQYDHTVQGATIVPPYSGRMQDGPNDAAVIAPILGDNHGIVIAHGLHPMLNRIDPYQGVLWAGVEALANITSVGGDIRTTVFLDNFISGVPNPHNLGVLDRMMNGLEELIHTFGIPCVSGKDSLGGTYRTIEGVETHVPPVLCITAVSVIDDVRQTITSSFKKPGETIIALVGMLDPYTLGGSAYYATHGALGRIMPFVDHQQFFLMSVQLRQLIRSGIIFACHDISDGGIVTTIIEMCIGGRCGASINLSAFNHARFDEILFTETAGCFVIEIDAEMVHDSLLEELPLCVLGKTTIQEDLRVRTGLDEIFTLPISVLRDAWQSGMKEICS